MKRIKYYYVIFHNEPEILCKISEENYKLLLAKKSFKEVAKEEAKKKFPEAFNV